MASGIGEAVIGKICEMAVRKLAQEANMMVHFREDFRWLREELRFVRGFLQDADHQSRQNDAVKQLLENIRDIAMRAEDISEECSLQSIYGFSFSQLYLRHKIGRKIRDIKDQMKYITEKANRLSLIRGAVITADEALPSTSQIASVELKRTSLLPRYSHPVGIQSKVDDILNLLNDPAIPVIAVVGMGGIGKTYLIQHVFNVAKERYEKSIWLSISQSYSVSMLQRDIASHLDLEGQIMERGVSEQRAAELIHERLKRISCLVVLDDVWRASREEDFLTKLGLPSNDNGQCKIVVTTRSKLVSINLNARMYEMECMSDEDSWMLFCVYAFRRFEEELEPQQQLLKEVGGKIVKQCGNLPLAVQTIAASLANTTDLSKWERKLHQLEQVIVSSDENDPIMAILKLSYDSLPTRLKACFAYLSFFPEDARIDGEDLINLWIGEGFIGAGEQQLEEAWDCLYQLVNLCLLQLWEEEDTYNRLIKRCKIHDLLLDLAIQISRENRCAFSAEEAYAITSDGSACSRILLPKKKLNNIEVEAISERRLLCLRTLSLSQNEDLKIIPEKLFSGMRGLRVLDLSYTSIHTLPASVGKMKLLKVLNLRGIRIREVPECVKHLKSLFFLALSDWCERLPVWISNLKCLQHLECKGVDEMPKGISKVASLRTLRSHYLRMFEDLGKMNELQELWLYVRDEMEWRRIEEAGIFAKLLKMRRLSLHTYSRRVEEALREGGEYRNKIKANNPNIEIRVR